MSTSDPFKERLRALESLFTEVYSKLTSLEKALKQYQEQKKENKHGHRTARPL